MRFETPTFWWAAAASALGWIVWAALLLAVRSRRFHNPETAS